MLALCGYSGTADDGGVERDVVAVRPVGGARAVLLRLPRVRPHHAAPAPDLQGRVPPARDHALQHRVRPRAPAPPHGSVLLLITLIWKISYHVEF